MKSFTSSLTCLFLSLLMVLFGSPAYAAANSGDIPPLVVAEDILIQTPSGEYTLRAGTQIVVESTPNLHVRKSCTWPID